MEPLKDRNWLAPKVAKTTNIESGYYNRLFQLCFLWVAFLVERPSLSKEILVFEHKNCNLATKNFKFRCCILNSLMSLSRLFS